MLAEAELCDLLHRAGYRRFVTYHHPHFHDLLFAHIQIPIACTLATRLDVMPLFTKIISL
jgi:hypothetical protein